MSEKTIVEINGVKLEVDMRYARRIDELRVGDRVQVLKRVYDGHKVHPGVIIGFEPFAKLPTIIVAYIEQDWSKADIKFEHYNANSKDLEIVAAHDHFDIDRTTIVQMFDRQIASKQREIQDLEDRKTYFETNFKAYWQKIEMPKATASD
jgi:hypothetical protein